jgi:uncharacterized protein
MLINSFWHTKRDILRALHLTHKKNNKEQMKLKEKIEKGIKEAMLAKDQDRLRTLRAIKSLILLAETEAGAKAELSDEDEIKLLQKAAKQRQDSLEIFTTQGRSDLAEKEKIELSIIEEFLPKQLPDAELEIKLKEIMTQVGASTPQDMGKVMGAATKSLAGQADGKRISAMVKSLLG